MDAVMDDYVEWGVMSNDQKMCGFSEEKLGCNGYFR